MKSYFYLLSLCLFFTISNNQYADLLETQPPYGGIEERETVERGAHYQVSINKSGAIYTELRNGMNYFENGKWHPTVEEFVQNKNGDFEANQGGYKVKLPRNLSISNPVRITTPDGKILRAATKAIRVISLNQALDLGKSRPTSGELFSENQVIYRNAFRDFKADILFTYNSGIFESDIILRQGLPDLEDLGIDREGAELQIVTEWFNSPTPEVLTHDKKVDYNDARISFGELELGHGTAYTAQSLEDTPPPLSERTLHVRKNWVTDSDGQYLYESLPYNECKNAINIFDNNKTLINENLVIDYVLLYNASNITFASGQTYWVRPSASNPNYYGGFGVSGTATFHGGAVIKYNRNAYLYFYGGVNVVNNDYPVVFTAVDDNSVGEVLSGIPPTSYYASHAFWSYYHTFSTNISRFEFKYCQEAARYDANPGAGASHTLDECRFQECYIGIVNTGNTTVTSTDSIFCDSVYGTAGTVGLSNAIVGCVPVDSPSMSANFVNVTPGQTMSGTATLLANGTGPRPITGARFYVDGIEVDVDGGSGTFSGSFDTTDFSNGSHTLTVALIDDGDIGTTGGDDSVTGNAAKHGVKHTNVTFNNVLSSANLSYYNFRPNLGEIQTITGTWSSPKSWRVDITESGDPSYVFKSFSGSGTSININWDGKDSFGQPIDPQAIDYIFIDQNGNVTVKVKKSSIGEVGKFQILYEGHHPLFGNYPTPNNTTFHTSAGFPWGSLSAPARIAKDLRRYFVQNGYEGVYNNGVLGDDEVVSLDFYPLTARVPGEQTGTGALSLADIGLFIGHSAQGKKNVFPYNTGLSYIPLYSSATDTFTFLSQADFVLGGQRLKWMAFYSCNMFRDSIYRTGGSYFSIKYHGSGTGIPMNTSLHTLHGFSTEMSVHSLFGAVWMAALTKKTVDPQEHTLIGAWGRVSRKTQPHSESVANENVARSIYWPECQGDYLQGYGPNTTPSQNNLQLELLEEDVYATD